jgi:hypothetical protein
MERADVHHQGWSCIVRGSVYCGNLVLWETKGGVKRFLREVPEYFIVEGGKEADGRREGASWRVRVLRNRMVKVKAVAWAGFERQAFR